MRDRDQNSCSIGGACRVTVDLNEKAQYSVQFVYLCRMLCSMTSSMSQVSPLHSYLYLPLRTLLFKPSQIFTQTSLTGGASPLSFLLIYFAHLPLRPCHYRTSECARFFTASRNLHVDVSRRRLSVVHSSPSPLTQFVSY
jgi:hypothetical protein